MTNNPLRYEISDWNDLNECLSNNSRDLFIRVSKLLGNKISGTVIEVKHALYGTLFATLVNPKGLLINSTDVDRHPIDVLTTNQIVEQLAIFGFYITFKQECFLPGSQLLALSAIKTLGFEQITRIYVRNKEGIVTPYVVAFNGGDCPKWLSYGRICEQVEYEKALADGKAAFVDNSSTKSNFDWDWLTYVANISDIFKANTFGGCR